MQIYGNDGIMKLLAVGRARQGQILNTCWIWVEGTGKIRANY